MTSSFTCSYYLFLLDIDECSKNGGPCDENADCLNNAGSYTCTCKDGFTGNGTVCVGTKNSEKVVLVSIKTYIIGRTR